MRTIIVGKNDAGQRLDKFLIKTFKALPVSLAYKFIRKKKIKVNRKHAAPGQILSEGDTLQLFIPEEFLVKEGGSAHWKTIVPHIKPVYEDENIIICNKPAGMLVHSDSEGNTDTLINHIKAYLYRKSEYDPDTEQSFAPALCNRIDRNTGGLVIAAKNAEALRAMNELIRQGKVKKKYLCIAHGIFEKKSDTLKGYIKKDNQKNLVTVYKETPSVEKARNVKAILTHYKVIAEKGAGDEAMSLLEVDLLTGRTHQIRAHLASIGHPLLGDSKYGNCYNRRAIGYKHQALCACSLEFDAFGPLKAVSVKLEPKDIWFVREFGVDKL